MALNASKLPKTGGNRKPVDPLEPGTYPARVVQIITLGLQEQNPYKGEPKPPAHELYVTYELLDEFMKDEEGNDIPEKPRWLSENFAFYSLDSDLAKSTKRYFALDPEKEHGGDWAALLGAPCMVTVIQKPSKKDPEVIYNNITTVSSMRAKEAAKAPDLVNEGKVFDVDEPDMDIFLSLPEWLQDKIKGNLDFEGSALEKALKGVQKPAKDSGKGGSQKASKAAPEPSDELPEASNDEEVDW
jgi:hypothetical protein